MKISAFVGHSFLDKDTDVVNQFVKFLNSLQQTIPEFSWEHAEAAEAKDVAEKVFNKIKDKNLFIGICTPKEITIQTNKIKLGFWNRQKYVIDKKDCEYKVSDWILQEIGLAKGIGLGRGIDFKIILLLEDNVRLPGALQGNVEHITFSRDKISDSFQKLMEMISSMKPTNQLSEQSIAQIETKEILSNIESNGLADNNPSNLQGVNVNDFIYQLIVASRENNFEGEFLKIRKEFENSSLSADIKNKLEFDVADIILKANAEKTDSIPGIKALIANHPDEDFLKSHLASEYMRQSNNEKALEIFLELISKTNDKNKKILYSKDAVEIFCEIGKTEEAKGLLKIFYGQELSNIEKENLLQAKLIIAKKIKDTAMFIALSESCLEMDPENNSVRFNLAYEYSNLGKQPLAIKHYKILTKKNEKEGYFNNLGVAYSRVDIVGLAMNAFKKAKDNGGTLAVSNIANQLIKIGDYELAEDMCKKVIGEKDCHPNVAISLSSIITTKEEETKKEEDLLKDNTGSVDFFASAGKAALESPPQSKDYKFNRNGIAYTISIDGDNISSIYTYEQRTEGLLSQLLNKEPQKYELIIKGKLTGKCATFEETKYNANTKEVVSSKSLLSGYSSEEPSKGLLYFSSDMSQVSFYKMDDSKISIDKK